MVQLFTTVSEFISNSISNHPVRTLIDVVLISFILYIISKKPFSPNKAKLEKPTEQVRINQNCPIIFKEYIFKKYIEI